LPEDESLVILFVVEPKRKALASRKKAKRRERTSD
jgi:hypothetical protein